MDALMISILVLVFAIVQWDLFKHHGWRSGVFKHIVLAELILVVITYYALRGVAFP